MKKSTAVGLGFVLASFVWFMGGAVFIGKVYKPALELPELVFKVGVAQCTPNGGLEAIHSLGERRYNFVCNNDARFLNQEVVAKDKEPGKVTAEAVIK